MGGPIGIELPLVAQIGGQRRHVDRDLGIAFPAESDHAHALGRGERPGRRRAAEPVGRGALEISVHGVPERPADAPDVQPQILDVDGWPRPYGQAQHLPVMGEYLLADGRPPLDPFPLGQRLERGEGPEYPDDADQCHDDKGTAAR